MATHDVLRGMSKQWAEQLVKQSQPVLATVSGRTENGLLLINIEGDSTGTNNVPEVATPNGPYDYQDGDRVFVYRSRNAAIPHQVSSFYYSNSDSTYYPRQRTDYIIAPSGTLELDATDVTVEGNSIVPDKKVKVSANDSTPGFLEDKINANSGVGSITYGDGGDEDLGIYLDIDGLTADASPDGAADYVAVYDSSAGLPKKVLLNNLPGGGGGVTGPATSTDNAVALFDGTDGTTLKDSLVTLDNTTGTVVLYNSATRGVLNVTQRSAAPSSPAAGDIYLDDGTNTTSSDPGLRHYTGTVWEDISGGAGGSGGAPIDATYIVQTANGTLTNEQALSVLESGDVQVTTTTGVLSSLKANRSASAAPTVGDDSSAGYSVGSRWIDTTSDREYVCLDASVGAAVWTETTASAGAGSGDVIGTTTSTDNAIARYDGTSGKQIQNSKVTITDQGILELIDDVNRAQLNIPARSSPPPFLAAGDVYLDDGTNTNSGNVGFRRFDGTSWFNIGGYSRRTLSSHLFYYVSTTGDDGNDGEVNPLATIQEAIDRMSQVDPAGNSMTIRVNPGTYTDPITLKSHLGPSIQIEGYGTPFQRPVISTTNANCITANTITGKYELYSIKLQTSTSGYGLQIFGAGSYVSMAGVEFGYCASAHIGAADGGKVDSHGLDYYVAGGAGAAHVIASYGGIAALGNSLVTFSTNPINFGAAYVLATLGGFAQMLGQTYTNKAYVTGKRYDIQYNSVVYTNNAGATFLPGTVAGTTATGGQYA